MRILVCVKRVPAPGAKINVTEDAMAVDTAHLGFTASPHEECALEEAVQIAERDSGEVTVLTLGPAEAEEQLRAGLSATAVDLAGDEQAVLVALTHVTSKASEAVHGAAETAALRFGVDDDGLIRAAAGAATQAAYQAALVIAAAEDEEHPFALKFQLFRAGRWPLGIIGGTFSIF